MPSDQPDILRLDKRPLRLAALGEYLKTGLTAAVMAPLVALRYLSAGGLRRPPQAPRDFVGVAVSPDPQWNDRLPDLVAELGVRHLLMRVPIWERDRFADYARFIGRFPGCSVLVAVLQNRASVCDRRRWRDGLAALFAALGGRASHFQLPLAANRTKWGCAHMGEALDLLEDAEAVRAKFPGVRLVGPALIDFEPLPMLRALINTRRFTLDAVTSLLYVDRRGGPRNAQYGIFDLARKLRLFKALASLSPRSRRRGAAAPLWITEVNWPLKGSGDYCPTSEAEAVSEDKAAAFLTDYYRIAYSSGLVERVYWWQLIHRGYGLIDDRDGGLRKRAAFSSLQKLVSGGISNV